LIEKTVVQLESVGDVIGHAIRVYRFNYLAIAQALIISTTICMAGRTLLQWGLSQQLAFGSLGPQIATCLGGFAISVWALWQLTLIQIALTVQLTLDGVSFSAALKRVQSKQLQIFNCCWIGGSACFLNALVWTLFAVGSSVIYSSFASNELNNLLAALLICLVTLSGLFFGTAITYIFGAFSIVITAFENVNLSTATEQCLSLIFHDFSRICGFVVAIAICLAAVLLPLYFPPLVVGVIEMSRYELSHSGKHLMKMPFPLLVFFQVWESLISMIVWPIFYISIGFFYRDLKMRQRASDVLENLDKLKSNGEAHD
jgi:hypothetical protein